MAKIQPWRDYDFGQIANGRLFFYVGAGLSRAAGLVGWNEMAAAISRFRREYEADAGDHAPEEDYARENSAYLRQFIEEKDWNNRPILSRASKDQRTFARTVFINFLLRYRKSTPDVTHKASPGPLQIIKEDDLVLHTAVWKTYCQGIFTTNYDMLLEEAFGIVRPSERFDLYGHPSALRTYRYYAQFLRFLLSVPRFALKMHGDVDDIGTMLFDPETAWERGNPLGDGAGSDLCHVFDAALKSGHMVYIGCGGRDRTFRELHKWSGRTSYGPYKRLFFVALAEVEDIIKEMGPTINDLVFLTYGSKDRPEFSLASSELRSFLGELTRCTKSRPHSFSDEAASLFSQLTGTLNRMWTTTDWDVTGVRLPKSWNQGSPKTQGLYLWRKREGSATPFHGLVREEEDWWGCYLAVNLEGREIWWRYDQPWSANGRPPDEEFVSYEWVGPLDNK